MKEFKQKYYQMKYFTNCKTPEEAKMLYRKLARELHPDMKSGNKEAFQEMEQQYRNFIAESLSEKQKQYTNKTDFINYLKIFFKENPELMQVLIKSLVESDTFRNFINKNSKFIDTGIGIYNLLKQKK
jgi:DnaJ-class molecular chaperone